jgi:YtkA-like
MKKLLIAALTVTGALAQAGVASAGCWATVGLAPPPDGTTAGTTWTASLTVLQHGRNPLPQAGDARPTLTIRNNATEEMRTFTAHPTGEPGVYEAAVVFPSAGSWRYEVFDDFTSWNGEPAPCAQTHTFAAVQIGGGAGAAGSAPGDGEAGGGGSVGSRGSESGVPLWPILGGSFAGLVAVAAAGAAGWNRRRARLAKG